MKRLLSIIGLILLWATSAFSYDIQITGDIPLADNLTGIAVNPSTNTAAAVSSKTNILYLIDVPSYSVIKNIPLGVMPSDVEVDVENNTAIVSSSSGDLLFIDLETGDLIKTISVLRHAEADSEPISAIALNRKGNTLYIAHAARLVLLDLKTEGIIRELQLPYEAKRLDIDTESGNLLLTKDGGTGLSIYDLETLEFKTEINAERIISGVSVNPSTHMAVLTNYSDSSISLASLENRAVIGTIPFQDGPFAVAVNHVNNTALISHRGGVSVVKLENPVPLINFIVPDSGRAGVQGLTLSIKGEKFIQDSRARFDTKELTTRFQDSFSLQADIPSSELKIPGNVDVSVVNPPPGGGQSNTRVFSIYNPIPAIEYITPDAIPLSHPELVSGHIILRVFGRNFMPSSTISFNGQNLKSRFISSILLEAKINPADVKSAGRYSVIVTNPSPGAFASNAVYLYVADSNAQAPSATNDNQTSLQAATASAQQSKTEGTLKGRILNTDKKPVEGVTIKIKNVSTVTDANGYFTLDNVPSGKHLLMLHGATARDSASHYPTIPLSVDVQAGRINAMPFQVYLHKQKDGNYKNINPNDDTVLTDPELPGFELRIPKGVKITGWDGRPNKKISVRTVPIDRLPVKPLPSGANVRTVYMFHFGKIGGGVADRPIPIKAKNDLGLLPGEKAILWYYDESPNEGEAPNDWAIAGTGTVTPDGKYIVTDHGVGIPKFCCGATAFGGQSANTEKSGPEDTVCSTTGDPVDLATGYFLHSRTDLHIPGIIPVNITRYYRNRESGSAVTGGEGLGAFGKGTYFEYDWWLGAYGADGNPNDTNPTMLLLIKPGNHQYRFTDDDADGVFTNDTDPAMSGAAVTYDPVNSTRTLGTRHGWKYKFNYKDRYNGELIELADRNDNKLTFTRRSRPIGVDDFGGYITGITTPEGRTVTFNQSYVGSAPTGIWRTDSITDSAGRTVSYSYETDPFSQFTRLSKVTYSDGGALQYRYDAEGRMSEIVNERGILEVFNEYYDTPAEKQNRIFRQTHADGGTYTFDYTIAGGNITETSMTGPNGAATTWRFYDDPGNFRDKYITQITTSDGVTKYGRELDTNLLLSVTDPINRTMTYTYYPNGQSHTITDNLGNVTTYEYEPLYGLLTKITDANLKETTLIYTFDTNNKVTKAEIRDPLLKLTTINYNAYGMQTGITDPNNNTTVFLYENAGKPAELTKIIDPLNNTTLIAYDSAGRLAAVTDANGKSISFGYDLMDRIKEVIDALGGVTGYAHGKTGNLLTVTDAKNHTIRYEYDDRDRIEKMTDQLGRVETYAYDTSDNLLSATDRKGQTTSYTYDSMNRLTRVDYADASYTTYTYDLAGRIDYINDSVSGFIDYTYNDFGCTVCGGRGMDRIAQETTPLGTIDYTYDNVGRRKTMTVAGQPVVNYDYYDNGWIEDIRQTVNGDEQRFNFAYDDGGRRTFQKYFKGTDINPTMQTTYGFDNANRLLNLQHLDPASQVLESLTYTYDANGNRTNMNRPSVALPLPNSISNNFYDNANQVVTFSDKNIVHDNNGNISSVTNTCGTTNYIWDVKNRLTGINGFNTDCSLLTASFQYDALGRRIQKTVNSVVTQYLYDGMDIIQELNQSGTVTTNYIRGLNIDEPLMRIKTDGTIRIYLTDALGSVVAVTDDSGVVKTTYTYDPFGNVTVSGESSDNPFQFAGREDDGTGLLFERNRYYSYELMRYISQDPIGLAGGDVNYYVRVGNNPVNWIDPFGLEFITSEEAEKLIEEFKTWIGTPYKTGGSKKGPQGGADCSHSTHQGYSNAGFPYTYSTTSEFVNNIKFRPSPENTPQIGDVALWKGHMAVYAGNGQIYTAHRPRGASYSLESLSDWKKYNKVSDPTWYRYYKPD